MNKWARKILISVAKVVAVVVAVLLLWWLFAVIADNDLVLPAPWEVLKITFRLLGKGETYLALLWTLARAAIAFVVSAAVALGLALLAGVWEASKPYVDGVTTFFRALPTVAVILLAMVAFQSTSVPVIVAFLVVFPVIYSAFMRETCNKKLAQMCKVYNVTAANKVRFVLLPQIGQCAFAQGSDSLPLCIKIVIAGEVLSLPRTGLGKEMYVAKVNLLTANVLALTLLALAVCFAISAIFSVLQRRCGK